jgi:hypothetical protein
VPGFHDVALRDLGLLLAAVALQRLATAYDPRPVLWPVVRPKVRPEVRPDVRPAPASVRAVPDDGRRA